MKGLYFYKLSSPYQEDITKDCKLTINEIDHNFITLKNADIKDINFDDENGLLTLNQMNGDKYVTKIDLSHFTKDFNVVWDKEKTSLIFTFDDKEIVIDELVSAVLDNSLSEIVKEIVAQTITDDTLTGVGVNKDPLRLNPLEIPGTYKAVERIINKLEGEELPNVEELKKGDRYLTYEKLNHYGYLYDYESIKKINEDLKGGWRVPTKEDWDNMLNAIELCDEYKNHSGNNNTAEYGKYAGKLLKYDKYWKTNNTTVINENEPKINPNQTNGVDSYGFSVYPAGYCNDNGTYLYMGEYSEFWTITEVNNSDVYVKRFSYNKSTVMQNVEEQKVSCSLRLVKDYDGNNFMGIEYIDGINYKTVLMPSENTKHGYSIWLASNFASYDEKYNPILPNNGEFLIDENAYYIHEWDGFKWLKKQLINGDSLIIKNCPNDKKNHEHQLIDNVLIDIKEDLHKELEDIVDNLVFDNLGESGEYISTIGQDKGLIRATTKTLVDVNDNILSYTDNGIKTTLNLVEDNENKENGVKKVYKVVDKNENTIGAPIVIDECTTNETFVSEDIRVAGGPLASLFGDVKVIKKGTNLQDFLINCFCKEIYPSNPTFNEGTITASINKPSFKVYIYNNHSNILDSGSAVEAGTMIDVGTVVCTKTNINITDSTWSGFDYGYSVENDNSVDGENNPNNLVNSEPQQESNYSLERIFISFNNVGKENVEENSDNTKLILPSINGITVGDGESSIVVNVTGASYSTEFDSENLKYYACSNLGNTNENNVVNGKKHNKITDKPTNNTVYNIQGVRYSFVGTFEDLSFTISSDNIRKKLTHYEYTAEKTTTIKAEKGKKCVVLAYPTNWGKLVDICDNKAFGVSILNEFEISECNVEGVNGYKSINYYVYVYKTKNITLQEIDYTIKF